MAVTHKIDALEKKQKQLETNYKSIENELNNIWIFHWYVLYPLLTSLFALKQRWQRWHNTSGPSNLKYESTKVESNKGKKLGGGASPPHPCNFKIMKKKNYIFELHVDISVHQKRAQMMYVGLMLQKSEQPMTDLAHALLHQKHHVDFLPVLNSTYFCILSHSHRRLDLKHPLPRRLQYCTYFPCYHGYSCSVSGKWLPVWDRMCRLSLLSSTEA